MDRRVKRGEIWMAQVGRKTRPVVVLTRSEVIDVRALVTVAEITTSIRGLAVEVPFDHRKVGLARTSVINCDGIHTVGQRTLTKPIGAMSSATMHDVCTALHHALGC